MFLQGARACSGGSAPTGRGVGTSDRFPHWLLTTVGLNYPAGVHARHAFEQCSKLRAAPTSSLTGSCCSCSSSARRSRARGSRALPRRSRRRSRSSASRRTVTRPSSRRRNNSADHGGARLLVKHFFSSARLSFWPVGSSPAILSDSTRRASKGRIARVEPSRPDDSPERVQRVDVLVTSLNPRAPSAVHPTGSVEGPRLASRTIPNRQQGIRRVLSPLRRPNWSVPRARLAVRSAAGVGPDGSAGPRWSPRSPPTSFLELRTEASLAMESPGRTAP